MTPFVARRRVEFSDTDMAGIMHFANFFRFMEFGEQEYLRSRGLSVIHSEAGTKYSFPRVAASCDYRKPARFEQVLEIVVTLDQVGSKALTFAFEFRHGGATLATGKMTSVCCTVGDDGVMRSAAVPDGFRAALTAG
jgi:acyl-CoA thioester hydrolase